MNSSFASFFGSSSLKSGSVRMRIVTGGVERSSFFGFPLIGWRGKRTSIRPRSLVTPRLRRRPRADGARLEVVVPRGAALAAEGDDLQVALSPLLGGPEAFEGG